MQQNIIFQNNSSISVETLPDYALPVVIKKPLKRHPPGEAFDHWKRNMP